MRKIDIIYRCCNTEVDTNEKRIAGYDYYGVPILHRPEFFDKIKCLNTFIHSVEQNKKHVNRVIFVHDGPKGSLYDNIPKDYEIVEVDYKNNELSLMETFKIADSLK